MPSVEVILVLKRKYSIGWNQDKHTHNFFHLFYITGGEGEITIEENSYIFRKDDVFLIPPDVKHGFKSGERSLTTMEVKFLVNKQNMYDELLRLPYRLRNCKIKVKNLLLDIVDEIAYKSSYYKEIINCDFMEVLFYFLRQNENEDRNGYEKYFPEKSYSMDKIASYIQKNISNSISLDDLSNAVSLSPSYLCKHFKNEIGVSPIKYINNLKLEKAKELMTNTSMNITEIAEYLGFGSIHYFSRFFKIKESIAPNDFKKMVENDIITSVCDNFIIQANNVVNI